MHPKKNPFVRLFKSPNWQYLAKVAAIAFAYALGAKIAVSIPGVNKLATCVWPPAGIAQAAILLFGWRFWPGIALGVFFYETINLQVSLTLATISAFCACLQAFCAFTLLQKLKFRPSLDRLIDVVNLIFCGAVVATQINCTLGTLRLCVTGLVDWNEYWQIRWNWYLGDTLGVLIFTPLLLIAYQKLAARHPQNTSSKTIVNTIWRGLCLLSLVTVSWLVYNSKSEGNLSRLSPRILTLSLGNLGNHSVWSARCCRQHLLLYPASPFGEVPREAGPFIGKAQNINQAILFLQAFMSVIVITSLLLAATVSGTWISRGFLTGKRN